MASRRRGQAAASKPLGALLVRAVVARRPGLGFIYAGDPAREAEGEPHTIVLKFKDGRFERGECNYDAHAACAVQQPEPGIIDVSGAGYYTFNSMQGSVTGDLFESGDTDAATKRPGGIRTVAAIGGAAFAAGLRGAVYRMETPRRWARIDDGLPDDFDIQAIGGTSASDVYAVGRGGSGWRFDGARWAPLDLPTSETLTCVACAGDGRVLLGGHQGVLLAHGDGRWLRAERPVTSDAIWSIAVFQSKTYVATMRALYVDDGSGCTRVSFTGEHPTTFYRLSVSDGVLWSAGEKDVMEFDGSAWVRIA